MKMPVIGAVLAATIAASGAQAATLYSENFNGQNGVGAFLNGVQPGTRNWSVDAGDAVLFKSNDYFGVVNDALELRDTNSGCLTSGCSGTEKGGALSNLTLPSWSTTGIDVSGMMNATMTFDLTAFGNMEDTGGVGAEDTLYIEASVDGVVTKTFDILGSLPVPGLNFTSQGYATSISFGESFSGASSVVFSIFGNTFANDERFVIDNVVVSGDAAPADQDPPVVPLPASALFLLAGLGSLAVARKRKS